jgi:hypothetical protein
MSTLLIVIGSVLLVLGLLAGVGYLILTRSGGLDSLHGLFKRLVLILLAGGFGFTAAGFVLQAV